MKVAGLELRNDDIMKIYCITYRETDAIRPRQTVSQEVAKRSSVFFKCAYDAASCWNGGIHR